MNIAEAEIAQECTSEWGRRVTCLLRLGWTYRGIARAAKTSTGRLHQMMVNPNYEPGYAMGMRVRKLHLRCVLAERKAQRAESGTAMVA